MYLGLKGKALTERVRELLCLIELEPDRYIDRAALRTLGWTSGR